MLQDQYEIRLLRTLIGRLLQLSYQCPLIPTALTALDTLEPGPKAPLRLLQGLRAIPQRYPEVSSVFHYVVKISLLILEPRFGP